VIGVVVLSYNKRAQLIEALASVERADFPDLVTVVIDNASGDGSAEAARARFRHFTVVANTENLGAAGGRNAGWKHLRRLADCDIVVFLDDDAEVTPSYFRRIADCFSANPWAGIVAGKTLTGPESGVIMSAGIAVNLYTGYIADIGTGEKDRGQYDKPRVLDACGGFALAVRASVFEKLDGIDERFNPYGWEEVDFCLRARKLGYKVLYEPRAVLCHKGTRAGRPPKADYERHKVRNYFRLLGRHASAVQKATCIFFVPLRMLRVAWHMVRTGHAGIILSQARGFLDGLRGPAR
jgi:GT2 family glycosyltransferase